MCYVDPTGGNKAVMIGRPKLAGALDLDSFVNWIIYLKKILRKNQGSK